MKSPEEKQAHYDRIAHRRRYWREKNAYYYHALEELLGGYVRRGSTVLEIGCGTGELLQALAPSRGVGIDFSPEMIRIAEAQRPEGANLHYRVEAAEALSLEEPFDYVVSTDLIGELTDIWPAFGALRKVCGADTRVVITTYNTLWEPILKLGEVLGLKMPQDNQNWLDLGDLTNLLELNGFEVISRGYHLPLPINIPLLSHLVNRYIGRLPLIQRLGLVTTLVARKRAHFHSPAEPPSVTVLVPCRNERGNIRAAVERIPEMGRHTEILFVDGNSNDGTVEEIEQVIEENRGRRDIRLLHQVEPGSDDGLGHGKMLKLGKGDAVRKGFDAASGEVLMILDSDLTVPPEELPRFYDALTRGYGELINGCRLVYPMEKEAMRHLNMVANHFFGVLFSWLLGQRIKDTLCGTKVLYKRDYLKIAQERHFFGDFDPFGDFDLLFGAARQNLKIVEMPVHYKRRTYGDIKIERFRHGLLLIKMSFIAMKKIKFG